ncbi:MAG: HEAT repeat domain-containing protein [Proteobacteria bacterium]|nr:HEAT repeat domain-containing protein [Pseudomonadota bacterium]
MTVSVGLADPRSEYLIRLLRSSGQFRVRAQAAVALGRGSSDEAVLRALEGALADRHPAVRAAAASALGVHGGPLALASLRRARGDREAAVRKAVDSALARMRSADGRQAASSPRGGAPGSEGPPASLHGGGRYYVGVGMPGSRVASVDRSTLLHARSFLERALHKMEGVVVAPEHESRRAAKRVIERKALRGYYLDSSVVSLERRRAGSVRAVVSIVVNTYPERNMKAVLRGAATVHGSSDGGKAIEGAYRGALRRLPQALASAQH